MKNYKHNSHADFRKRIFRDKKTYTYQRMLVANFYVFLPSKLNNSIRTFYRQIIHTFFNYFFFHSVLFVQTYILRPAIKNWAEILLFYANFFFQKMRKCSLLVRLSETVRINHYCRLYLDSGIELHFSIVPYNGRERVSILIHPFNLWNLILRLEPNK